MSLVVFMGRSGGNEEWFCWWWVWVWKWQKVEVWVWI